jgi:choline dehydrogenase-like flavoprotein
MPVIIDGSRRDGDVPVDFDICIVGAGPAGLVLADRLRGRGMRIGLIEAGGPRPTIRNQRMLVDRPSGSGYWDLQNVRVRMVGGSGNRWGGICRPLDGHDLARRDWVDNSGWPLSWSDLAPYYVEAGVELELTDADFARSAPDLGARPPDLPPDSGFEIAHYRLSPRLDFGQDYTAMLRRSHDVTLVTGTNVVELRLGDDGHTLASVETRTFAGARRVVTARRFVLAAGGVENARLLLVSPGRGAAALGNEHDVVGRYFMEHVHAPMAEFVPSDGARLWSSYHYATRRLPRLTNTLVPAVAVQYEQQLLNAALSIGPMWYLAEPPFVHWDYHLTVPMEMAYRALVAGGPRRTRVARLALEQGRGLWQRVTDRDLRTRGDEDRTRLVYYRGEQPPRRENRVELGAALDEFGRPLAHLHWTVGEQETSNAETVVDRFRELVGKHDLGTVGPTMRDWREHIIGGPHHLGTTRMSDDPRYGVVDADCRVHSVDNLYVAGSSVFATGGHANPTLTLIALTLRLADHLLVQAS